MSSTAWPARNTAHVDIEAHALRLLALVRIGADADRQHEVAHEHAVGRRILAGLDRIAARREQPIIDLGRGQVAGAAGCADRAGSRPRTMPTACGSIAAVRSRRDAQRAAEAEVVRLQQQQARDVGRLQRTGEARRSARASRAAATKSRKPAISMWSSRRPAPLRGGIEHRAGETGCRHHRQQRVVGALIGEHHADDLALARERRRARGCTPRAADRETGRP